MFSFMLMGKCKFAHIVVTADGASKHTAMLSFRSGTCVTWRRVVCSSIPSRRCGESSLRATSGSRSCTYSEGEQVLRCRCDIRLSGFDGIKVDGREKKTTTSSNVWLLVAVVNWEFQSRCRWGLTKNRRFPLIEDLNVKSSVSVKNTLNSRQW